MPDDPRLVYLANLINKAFGQSPKLAEDGKSPAEGVSDYKATVHNAYAEASKALKRDEKKEFMIECKKKGDKVLFRLGEWSYQKMDDKDFGYWHNLPPEYFQYIPHIGIANENQVSRTTTVRYEELDIFLQGKTGVVSLMVTNNK